MRASSVRADADANAIATSCDEGDLDISNQRVREQPIVQDAGSACQTRLTMRANSFSPNVCYARGSYSAFDASVTAILHLGRDDGTGLGISPRRNLMLMEPAWANKLLQMEAVATLRTTGPSSSPSTTTPTASTLSRVADLKSGSASDSGRSIVACRASSSASVAAPRRTLGPLREGEWAADEKRPREKRCTRMPKPRQRVRLQDGLWLDLNKLLRDGYGPSPATNFRVSGIRWTSSHSGEIASGFVIIKKEGEDRTRGPLPLGPTHFGVRTRRRTTRQTDQRRPRGRSL
jgi:hypothetical protein